MANKKTGDELQTLSRGLAALAFLNENGLTDLSSLARRLEIPRANAYRILKTLIAEGYCTRIPNSRLYLVTPDVRRLSAGLREGEMLTSVSIGVIEKLGATVKWPVALATPHGSQMLVRLTTDRTTSLALAKIDPGHVTAMLQTTTGLLYLALESPDISTKILTELRNAETLSGFRLTEGLLEENLQFARTHGYLVMDTIYPEGCLGVPIINEGRPIGGVVLRYIKSAVSRQKAVDAFLPLLLQAADEILRLYRARIEMSPSLNPAPA